MTQTPEHTNESSILPVPLAEIASIKSEQLNPLGQVVVEYLHEISQDPGILLQESSQRPLSRTTEVDERLRSVLLPAAIHLLGELNARMPNGLNLYVSDQRLSDVSTPEAAVSFDQAIQALRDLGIENSLRIQRERITSGNLMRNLMTREPQVALPDALTTLAPYVMMGITQAAIVFVPHAINFREALLNERGIFEENVRTVTLPLLLELQRQRESLLAPLSPRGSEAATLKTGPLVTATTAVPSLPERADDASENSPVPAEIPERPAQPRFTRIDALGMLLSKLMNTNEQSPISAQGFYDAVAIDYGGALTKSEINILDRLVEQILRENSSFIESKLIGVTRVNSTRRSGPATVRGFYLQGSIDELRSQMTQRIETAKKTANRKKSRE
jgi:hypothetical protein